VLLADISGGSILLATVTTAVVILGGLFRVAWSVGSVQQMLHDLSSRISRIERRIEDSDKRRNNEWQTREETLTEIKDRLPRRNRSQTRQSPPGRPGGDWRSDRPERDDENLSDDRPT
jgi:hypothetical protein